MADLMQCPACLERKGRNFAICSNCFDEYGSDREAWPEWLRFLVNDNKRIAYQDTVLQECEISEADLGCTIEEIAESGW